MARNGLKKSQTPPIKKDELFVHTLMKAKEKTNLTGKIILVKLTLGVYCLVDQSLFIASKSLKLQKILLVFGSHDIKNKAGGKNTEGNRHRRINMS